MAVYYWDVYSVDMYYGQAYEETNWHISGISSSKPAFIGTNMRFNILSGAFRLTGYQQYSAGNYPSMRYVTIGSYQEDMIYYCPSGIYGTGTDIYPIDPNDCGIYTNYPTPEQGVFTGTVSSSSITAYPQNGTNDNTNWYILRGAPSRINYPAYLNPGREIKITWDEGINPAAYRLQRSVDGGASWVTLTESLTQTEYIDTQAASIAGLTKVIYRICTLGESVQSEYTVGGMLNISQSSLRAKEGGTWLEPAATLLKANGTWTKLEKEDEASIITQMSKYNITRVT